MHKEGEGMLELNHITKSYEGRVVLDDISISIKDKHFISILGPSGCGKTTLLKIILGLEQPDQGKIKLNGEDITQKSPNQRNFGIAFQNYALFPHLNALENIKYGIKNQTSKIKQEELEFIIDKMDLRDHIHKPVQKLSGGQKQRVSLARAMAIKPRILLLDEPLSALDGVVKEKVKKLILATGKELGLTTIMVTHDPEEALTMSDAIVLLNEGKVIQYDGAKNIIENPKELFVKQFITDLLRLKYRNIERVLYHD